MMEHLRPLSVTQLYPSTPADFSFVGAAASTATSAAATRQPLAEPSGNGRAQQHHSAPHIHQPRAAYRSNAAIPLYHGIHHMVHHQAHKLPLGSLATAGPLTVPSPTPTPPQSVDPWCFLSGGSSSDGRHSYKRERFAGRVRPCRRHPFYLVSEFSQYREKQKGRPETEKNWPELLEDAILDGMWMTQSRRQAKEDRHSPADTAQPYSLYLAWAVASFLCGGSSMAATCLSRNISTSCTGTAMFLSGSSRVMISAARRCRAICRC